MEKRMGILNLTPDSFFPESRMLSGDGSFDGARFLSAVQTHLDKGADIIDLGACSTRPGYTDVGAQEEWRRLQPALELWKRHFFSVPLSIDTYHAEIARRCAPYSEHLIINDISAGDYDSDMLSTVAELGCGYVAMHHDRLREADGVEDRAQGPEDGVSRFGGATLSAEAAGALSQVEAWYEKFSLRAESAGLKDWWFDPGYGFGKSLAQNWALLRHLDLLPHERPILVGLSRKSMLYKLLPEASDPKYSPSELAALPQTKTLTRLANRLARLGGASIFRVHDIEDAF
ncbi:MAG: dihydropteroate synthase [Bacteroidales bacterium]|nr:dihydropteroate synthase [Bacteroidales bacterium]